MKKKRSIYFVINVDILGCGDVAQPRSEDVVCERLEAELGATRRDWFDNATDVVADEAEASRLGVFLHRPAQRRLRQKFVLNQQQG